MVCAARQHVRTALLRFLAIGRGRRVALGGAVLVAAVSALAHANDFPTRARVEFVLDCMRESKLAAEEAMYKCSCAIDEIAAKVDYATYVDMSTVSNAITIAGERGGVVRDMKDGRKIATSFRELQAEAKKRCFISN